MWLAASRCATCLHCGAATCVDAVAARHRCSKSEEREEREGQGEEEEEGLPRPLFGCCFCWVL